MSSEIKTFRIKAQYTIQRKTYVFSKEIRALDKDKALEKFYSELGAQKVTRNQIKILSIEEIPPEAIKNRKLKKLALSEAPALYVE